MKDPAKIRKHFADKFEKLIKQYPEVASITYSKIGSIQFGKLNRFERFNEKFSLLFYTRNDSQQFQP
jgi:hypothetical protein